MHIVRNPVGLYYNGELVGVITNPDPIGSIEEICGLISPNEGLCATKPLNDPCDHIASAIENLPETISVDENWLDAPTLMAMEQILRDGVEPVSDFSKQSNVTADNLTIHYMDEFDNESVREISPDALMAFFSANGETAGDELADNFENALTITNRDPRQSELEETDIFISYNDIISSGLVGAELMCQIPDEFFGDKINESHDAGTDF